MKLTNRISESKRRIASLNRSDESNQRIEPQNGSKTTPKRSKTSPKTAQIGPKSSQERPKMTPRQPKIPPGALLERSWRPSWDHPIIRSQSRPSRINLSKIQVRFWTPKRRPKRHQIDPKTMQKSIRKMHHFFIALGAVLDRS